MLLSKTSTTTKNEYSYDEYLRLSEVTETVLEDGKSFTFGYEYDLHGRLVKEIYPHATGEKENSTLNYVYDDYGYPVKKYLGTTLIWEAKEYAEQGQLSKYILGNNITVTKEFDNQGRLTNITGLKGSNTYQNMSYGYRGDGNMHFRTDATNSVNKKEWFKYDTQNRLIGWETTSLNAAEPEYQTRISYEGNRISQKENIGNYVYSGFPHHGIKSSGVTTVTNNALGISYDHNMIDGRARVSSIISGNNSVTYTHGTSDELIKKTETKNGNTYTTYYAGGGKYELRIDNNNAETKLSYLGSGVVKYDTPGTTDDKILYLLKDHLGSVVKVLSINNNTITVEENFSYDVWGNRRNPTTWENTNITTPIYIYKGFTGHEHIEGFGLIHMKGRVYDPALGLFLSPDPYVQSATTMGFNRYSYCMGNPLMFTDPEGEWFGIDDLLIAGVGFAYGYISNGIKTGEWKGSAALSGGISAISSWLAYNTVGASMSATNFIKDMAINAVVSEIMPSANIQISDGFSISITPTFMMGSQGIGAGVNLGVNSRIPIGNNDYIDFGLSVGVMGNSLATGTNARNILTARYGGGLTYVNKDFNVSLYTMGFASGDNTSQRVGGIGVGYGKFSVRYENDGAPFNKILGKTINDGGDRYRTAAVDISWADFHLRLNMFTGDSRTSGEPLEKNTKKYKHGYYECGNVDSYRLGALSFGYKNHYVGVNSEAIRHIFQNKLAHTYLSPQPSFKVLNNDWSLFYNKMYYDRYTLW